MKLSLDIFLGLDFYYQNKMAYTNNIYSRCQHWAIRLMTNENHLECPTFFFFTEPFLARSSAKSSDGYVWWFGLFSEKEWKRISVTYLPQQLLASEEWAETVLKKAAAERTLLSCSVMSDSL